CLDDALAALRRRDRVVVGHRLATGLLDLVDDLLRSGVAAALAVDGPAEVVDDDLGATARQVEGVGAAQAAAGAGDDRDPAVEGDLSHAQLLQGKGNVSSGIVADPAMAALRRVR